MAKVHSQFQELAISTAGIGGPYTELQALREGTMSQTKTMAESTCRADGGYTSKLNGLRTITLTANCAWDEADAELMALVDAWEDDSAVHAQWIANTGSGLRRFRGEVLVSDMSRGAPVDDLQTCDVTLEVTGTPTFDTQP